MQFKQLIGNTDLANTLTLLADEGRISHAQLLVGKDGYGGLPLAVAFAQYINCNNRQKHNPEDSLRADSCGKCPSCVKYEKLAHPDLHFFFPNTTTKKVTEKNSSVDFISDFRDLFLKKNGYFSLSQWYDQLGIENKQAQINIRDGNNLLDALSLTPYESPFQIFILWHVEKLNIDTAPRLLKSLEEPAPHTLFFLLTDDLEHLLPTILSRTQKIYLRPLSPQETHQSLLKNGPENTDLPLLERVSHLSKGDYLTALSLLTASEELIAFQAYFIRWMRAVIQFRKQIDPLVDVIADLSKLGREELKRFLDYSLELMRGCLHISLGLDPRKTLFASSDEKFQQSFPLFINLQNITPITKSITDAMDYISRNANAKVVFMDLSIAIGIQLSVK